MEKLLYKAIAAGVFNSPDDSQIIVIDPDHKDERAHSPQLSATEALMAHERGLIEDPEKHAKAKETVLVDVRNDPNSIETIAAARTEEASSLLGDDVAPAGLESRSSTAWQNPDAIFGGVEGRQQDAETGTKSLDLGTGEGEGEEDEHDDDAPPASATSAPTPTPTPAPILGTKPQTAAQKKAAEKAAGK